MQTYIGLLRGINVGGHKKIKMSILKQLLVDIGLLNVQTYIQSGNIVFDSVVTSLVDLEIMISKEIVAHFGFETSILIMTQKELKLIYDKNPYLKLLKEERLEEKKIYFTFLYQNIESSAMSEIEIILSDEESFELNLENKTIYLYYGNGYGQTKLTNNFLEKKLTNIATTRNFRTVSKLLELSYR